MVGVSFLRLLSAEVELEVEGAVQLEGGAEPCGPGVGGELEAQRWGEDVGAHGQLGGTEFGIQQQGRSHVPCGGELVLMVAPQLLEVVGIRAAPLGGEGKGETVVTAGCIADEATDAPILQPLTVEEEGSTSAFQPQAVGGVVAESSGQGPDPSRWCRLHPRSGRRGPGRG